MHPTMIQNIAIWVIPVLFAISLHEVAHGWVASWFGDQTARFSGRLSLNPMHHIDLVGTIIVPLFMLLTTNFVFGWAKPVPVDPRNMHNPRWNMLVVALAGPVSNLLMALAWGGMAKLGLILDLQGNEWLGMPLMLMGRAGILINVVLAVLNLLPLPPLDGGKVLMSVLPPRTAYQLRVFEPYAFLILVLLMFSGVLSRIMLPPIAFLIDGISALCQLPMGLYAG